MLPPHAFKLRIGRVSEVGRAYLITTVTFERRPLFADFALARAAIHELRRCDACGFSSTLSFVLMPDHLHWLVQLNDGTLADLLRHYKSRSAMTINRLRDTPRKPVWHAGFYDRAVRDGEDVRQIARYIVANPIRAGLSPTAGDYSHWDAMWL